MEKVILKSEFEKKGKNLVFKEGSKQILLLEAHGRVFALDNRCPHEGYPLSQGVLDSKSCALTCNWHNWKFDLETGTCISGGDRVATYPLSIKGKEIRIDLREPDPDAVFGTIVEDLKTAFFNRGRGRMCRELARLTFHGLDPLRVVEKAVLWSYEKLEEGTTHAYAGLADWITLYKKSSDREDKIICLVEALDHMAFDCLRHGDYPYHRGNEAFSKEGFLAAIENEETKKAEGMALHALEEGWGFDDFDELLSEAALTHYSNFGHSLIYVVKARELAQTFPTIHKALVLSLVRYLCSYPTREELLPKFKTYASTVKSLEQSPFGKEKCGATLPKMNVSASYKWLKEEQKRCTPSSLYESILNGNAENFLQFDRQYQERTDGSISENVGWLDFTHGLTFSNAVRRTCEKYPELWPKGLAQMASFYGRNTPFCDETIRREDWMPKSDVESTLVEKILDHGQALPIFSVHLLKTAVAVFEEAEHCGGETRSTLYAGLNRFFHSPLKQKHVRRSVHQAIALVSKDFQ